jgi:hypothetical protein
VFDTTRDLEANVETPNKTKAMPEKTTIPVRNHAFPLGLCGDVFRNKKTRPSELWIGHNSEFRDDRNWSTQFDLIRFGF